MGGVVQNKDSSVLGSFCSHNQEPLSLSHFPNPLVLSNGHAEIRMQSGDPGLFYSKQITSLPEKESFMRWAKRNYRHSCNVVKYEVETMSMFCSTHMNFKAILQYGNQNLAQILEKKETSMNTVLDRSQTTITERTVNTSIQILQFIKFLIEVIEEHLKTSGEWVIFHTTNLVYLKHLKRFKFLHLPSEGFLDREVFYDPYSQQKGLLPSQTTTVFSIGMILMSLLLKEDCSDCYNYQNLSFCWSIFEEKKDKIREELRSKPSHDLSYSEISSQVEDQVLYLTMLATSSDSRASFQEIKTLYYGILRKISSGSGQHCDELRKKREGKGSRVTGQVHRKYTLENASDFQNKENQNRSNIHPSYRYSSFIEQSQQSADKLSQVREKSGSSKPTLTLKHRKSNTIKSQRLQQGGRWLNI